MKNPRAASLCYIKVYFLLQPATLKYHTFLFKGLVGPVEAYIRTELADSHLYKYEKLRASGRDSRYTVLYLFMKSKTLGLCNPVLIA
jgi:hypothetical protein